MMSSPSEKIPRYRSDAPVALWRLPSEDEEYDMMVQCGDGVVCGESGEERCWCVVIEWVCACARQLVPSWKVQLESQRWTLLLNTPAGGCQLASFSSDLYWTHVSRPVLFRFSKLLPVLIRFAGCLFFCSSSSFCYLLLLYVWPVSVRYAIV